MSDVKQEVLRMELQVGELIRIVANMNERLNKIEDKEKRKQTRKSSFIHTGK